MKNLRETITRVPVVPPKANREERKEQLQESIDKYLGAIETQIGDLKKVGKNALVIGGIIVAVYAVTELLLPAGKKTIEDHEPLPEPEPEKAGDSMLWAAMKGAATSILLAVAKEKLLELIDHLTTKDAEATS
ncbi:hypothetical protein [Emticicia fluvialis]|uniref:hypothetical protein n=1 Tax=Emticicia fluvialis TaxID=2974474 RepID=UPI002166BBD2|nr:hypothetical protein [Emticicia fluvialis]